MPTTEALKLESPPPQISDPARFILTNPPFRFYYFLNVLFISERDRERERERERKSKGGADREEDTESKAGSRL